MSPVTRAFCVGQARSGTSGWPASWRFPPATLDASRGHRDRGASPVRVTSPGSPAWLRAAVEELCAPHAARLFPETDRG